MNRKIWLTVIAICPLALGAMIPAAADPEPGLSYAGDVESLVVKRCAGCHNTEDPKAKLLLEQDAGYDQLVGRASVQVPQQQLVVAGDPSSSYLWHKLDFTAEVGKGMPRTLLGAKRLPEEELNLLRRWIEDGALP